MAGNRSKGYASICSKHTPCAVRELRHTECAYYVRENKANKSINIEYT